MRELVPFNIGTIVDKSEATVFTDPEIEPFIDNYHPEKEQPILTEIRDPMYSPFSTLLRRSLRDSYNSD